MFWPEWVEVEGCVLRRDVADADNVRRWLATDDGSVQQTEWALNHVHLYDEVEEGWEEPDEVLDLRLEEVAQRLAGAWRASLAVAFPSRTFVVDVAGPGPRRFRHACLVWLSSDEAAVGSARRRGSRT